MTRRNRLGFAAMWIAASALVLAGCGGESNAELYAHGMARIAALEEAAVMTQETAGAAMTDAATARGEAHAAEAAAAAAQMEAEATGMRAMEAQGTAAAAAMQATEAEGMAAATAMRAELAEEATGELQAQLDRQAVADAQYDPTDPGGTLEGAAGREEAERLAAAAAGLGAWPGTSFPTVSGRLFDRGAIGGLQGSAVYRGPATGRYAIRSEAGHEATSGRFAAIATIMANFDRSSSAQRMSGYTGGLDFNGSRIDDFLDRDGDMDMSGWVVNLRDANVAAAGAVSGVTTAVAGDHLWYGVWEAWFHGIDHAIHPTGIVGRFKAVGGTAQPVATPEGRIDQFLDSGLGVVIGSFRAPQWQPAGQ